MFCNIQSYVFPNISLFISNLKLSFIFQDKGQPVSFSDINHSGPVPVRMLQKPTYLIML